jgi:hypothetical protein
VNLQVLIGAQVVVVAIRALLLSTAWLVAIFGRTPKRREVAFRLVELAMTPLWRRGVTLRGQTSLAGLRTRSASLDRGAVSGPSLGRLRTTNDDQQEPRMP